MKEKIEIGYRYADESFDGNCNRTKIPVVNRWTVALPSVDSKGPVERIYHICDNDWTSGTVFGLHGGQKWEVHLSKLKNCPICSAPITEETINTLIFLVMAK